LLSSARIPERTADISVQAPENALQDGIASPYNQRWPDRAPRNRAATGHDSLLPAFLLHAGMWPFLTNSMTVQAILNALFLLSYPINLISLHNSLVFFGS
jgi:hypothetical protein